MLSTDTAHHLLPELPAQRLQQLQPRMTSTVCRPKAFRLMQLAIAILVSRMRLENTNSEEAVQRLVMAKGVFLLPL